MLVEEGEYERDRVEPRDCDLSVQCNSKTSGEDGANRWVLTGQFVRQVCHQKLTAELQGNPRNR